MLVSEQYRSQCLSFQGTRTERTADRSGWSGIVVAALGFRGRVADSGVANECVSD